MSSPVHAKQHAHTRRFHFRFGFAMQTISLFAIVGAVLWTLLLSSFLETGAAGTSAYKREHDAGAHTSAVTSSCLSAAAFTPWVFSSAWESGSPLEPASEPSSESASALALEPASELSSESASALA